MKIEFVVFAKPPGKGSGGGAGKATGNFLSRGAAAVGASRTTGS